MVTIFPVREYCRRDVRMVDSSTLLPLTPSSLYKILCRDYGSRDVVIIVESV